MKKRLTEDQKRVLAKFDKNPRHWLRDEDLWPLIDLAEMDLVVLESAIARRKNYQ